MIQLNKRSTQQPSDQTSNNETQSALEAIATVAEQPATEAALLSEQNNTFPPGETHSSQNQFGTESDQVASVWDISQGNALRFRFGPGSKFPTALQGTNRPRIVLPGSNYSAGISAIVNLRQDLTEDQFLVLELTGGEHILAFDFSYTHLFDSPREGISANIFNQRSYVSVFRGGDREVDLPGGDTPWIHRLGGGVEYFFPVAPQVSTALGLSYQRVSIRDDIFTSDIEPEDELGNPLTFSEAGQDDLMLLAFVGLYSTVDDLQYPTRGSKIRFGTEQAIPIGDAEIGFNRLSANVTQFIPFNLFGFSEGPRTLVLNVQGGTIIGDAPPYEAFSLGGLGSVRGYEGGGVGTGKSFLQATVEYRFPITSFDVGDEPIDLGGTLFVDFATDLGTAEDVTGEPAEVRDKPGDGLGFGVGLRARTPFGPARLEFGLNDEGDSEVYFTLGERF
jgi:outer membrane protein insertion porin family